MKQYYCNFAAHAGPENHCDLADLEQCDYCRWCEVEGPKDNGEPPPSDLFPRNS